MRLEGRAQGASGAAGGPGPWFETARVKNARLLTMRAVTIATEPS